MHNKNSASKKQEENTPDFGKQKPALYSFHYSGSYVPHNVYASNSCKHVGTGKVALDHSEESKPTTTLKN